MMSLFDVAGTQTIGRFINPVDGTAASNNSYAWNDPVGASGRLSQFIIYAHAGGTLQLARYVKSGSTLTRVGLSSVVTIGSAGLKTLTAADYGTFSVNAGDYLAVYCNGVLAFNEATADGGGWFNFASGLPASGTAGTLD